MRILLLGYGKMGKALEEVAQKRGHVVSHVFDQGDLTSREQVKATDTDVAIEFTEPEAAYGNIEWALQTGIPIVSGTTGWLSKKPDLDALCLEKKGAFFYASNYSIGVNLFFRLSEIAAKLIAPHEGYQVSMAEIHHTAKKDKPSGTAITLAEGILPNFPQLSGWQVAEESPVAQGNLPIHCFREAEVPGTHEVRYTSAMDEIRLTHVANTRMAFAEGAIVAAEWIQGKKGVFSMRDLLP
jgi:4-hydroxy-tetrahydrodipicolinate reductase